MRKKEKRKDGKTPTKTPQNFSTTGTGRTTLTFGQKKKVSVVVEWTYEGRRKTILPLSSITGIGELTPNPSFLGEFLSVFLPADYNSKLGVVTATRVIEANAITEGIQTFYNTFKRCQSCGEPGDLELRQHMREGLPTEVFVKCPTCKLSKIDPHTRAGQAVVRNILTDPQLKANTIIQEKVPGRRSQKPRGFIKPFFFYSFFVLLFSLSMVWFARPDFLVQQPVVIDNNTGKIDTIKTSNSNRPRINVTDFVPALESEVTIVDGTLEIFSDQHSSDLMWGTYRPNLYFGMRTRAGTDSLLLGMMWYEPGSNPYHVQLHHVSKSQDDINMKWIHHNGRDYGMQLIHDTKSDVFFTVYFWKRPGENGGDWVVRVKGDFNPARPEKKNSKIAVMFYIGIENQKNGRISLSSPQPGAQRPLPGTVKLGGYTPATGDFALILTDSKKGTKKEKSSTFFSGIRLKEVWRIEQHLRLIVPKGSRRAHAQLENIVHEGGNVFVLQRFKKVPFEIDMVFLSSLQRFPTATAVLAEANAISGTALDQVLQTMAEDFEKKFDETYGLGARQFSREYQEFAMVAFSNLMGGIGYFNGQNRIYLHNEQAHEPQYKMSDIFYSLFTATPSRRFFPRGFLWDEGFHQLIISAWDKELSKDMIAHWLRLIDENGWIAREQILGPEAESSVPPEFIVQYPDHANPPTIYLSIEKILEKGDLTQHDILFLKGVFKHLLSNFIWFLKTQRGVTTNSWYWRGAKGNHTLPSGFDDYPRADVRTSSEEHVDLLCWITLAANILDKIAKSIDVYDVSQFKLIEDELIRQLEELHWNDEINAYCDYDGASGQHVKHIGYLSLFPFLFGLIPVNSPRLGHVLDIMEDPKILKTNYGLRSLSASDVLFETGENYWRGAIFININYLVLRALYRYYSFGDGPYTQRAKNLYHTLRSKIISNLYRVFHNQNDFFEQYNPHTGAGQGQHPFTGWTSLIVLIMAETY